MTGRLGRSEIAEVVALAGSGRIGDPSPADLWLSRNLANFLRRGRSLPVLSGRILGAIGSPPFHPSEWAAFAHRLAEVVAARRLSVERTARISVPQAVGMLDLSLRREARADDRRRVADAVAAARHGEPSWRWVPAEGGIRAEIAIGAMEFYVVFGGGETGSWVFAWGMAPDTGRMLSRWGRPSGLFPKIDGCLRAIMTEFVTKVRPLSVHAIGADAKRSRYMASAFRETTAGYSLHEFPDPVSGEPREIEIRADAPEPQRRLGDAEWLAVLSGPSPEEEVETAPGM